MAFGRGGGQQFGQDQGGQDQGLVLKGAANGGAGRAVEAVQEMQDGAGVGGDQTR